MHVLENDKEPNLSGLYNDCMKDVLKELVQEEMSNVDNKESAEVED